MPNSTHLKFVASIDMYLHAKNQLNTCNSFWDKNPAIWLAKSIFVFNPRTRLFPNYGAWYKPKKSRHQWTFFCKIQKTLSLGCFWALSPKWDFFPKLQLRQFLPLRHSKVTRSFRKIQWAILEKKRLPTDILTFWQWWNHRTPFCLKLGVQKFGSETSLNCLV